MGEILPQTGQKIIVDESLRQPLPILQQPKWGCASNWTKNTVSARRKRGMVALDFQSA
jgi:hypothetical protein